jgi:protease IV
MIFALVLLVLLVLSLAANMQQAVSSAFQVTPRTSRASGPRLEEAVIREARSNSKIAVVELDGIITGDAIDSSGYTMVSYIKAQLKRAKGDEDVKAVILKVDSPGGEVLASDEIAGAIRKFQKDSRKPVVVSMGSLAASGGYYVSAPSQWIVANELTITGSIGVIMHGLNYRGLLDKVGVLPQVYKSGKFKDMMSPEREPDQITPEERQMMQSLIDETYGKFKDVVEKGRHSSYDSHKGEGRELKDEWADYADGRILSGKKAYDLGFVDELGDFETAVDRAKKLAHLSGEASLIRYQQVYDLSDLFRVFGKSDTRGLKVDLGVEIPKLRAGYLYFLSPTYLH